MDETTHRGGDENMTAIDWTIATAAFSASVKSLILMGKVDRSSVLNPMINGK